MFSLLSIHLQASLVQPLVSGLVHTSRVLLLSMLLMTYVRIASWFIATLQHLPAPS